ncbi:hypothetical protein K8374_13360 [Pseudomonas sp. p1(2021b)]|uniref:hypothetical protein n=1 Tax=Pseudomonas sp. p1(2021b) TaxID=2874628 RepID=UPI001CCA551C|nr:hypothetical protein [Pseudomonas sp. p1(2021b)]UBM23390.1 hypothetical protein K8374_13360 [Pseudomonas sp. p1(2021b)]
MLSQLQIRQCGCQQAAGAEMAKAFDGRSALVATLAQCLLGALVVRCGHGQPFFRFAQRRAACFGVLLGLGMSGERGGQFGQQFFHLLVDGLA